MVSVSKRKIVLQMLQSEEPKGPKASSGVENLIELNEFLNVRGRSRKGRQDVEGAAEK